MLVRKLELENKIEDLENIKFPSYDDLDEMTPLNSRFIIQKCDPTESKHGGGRVIGSLDLYSFVDQSEEIKKIFFDLLTDFQNELRKTGESADSAQRLINPPRKTREEEMKWMENNKDLLAN